MKKLYLHLLASIKKYDTLEALIKTGDSVGVDVMIDNIPTWEKSPDMIPQLGGNIIRAVIDKLYPEIKEKRIKQIQKETVVYLTHKGH